MHRKISPARNALNLRRSKQRKGLCSFQESSADEDHLDDELIFSPH